MKWENSIKICCKERKDWFDKYSIFQFIKGFFIFIIFISFYATIEYNSKKYFKLKSKNIVVIVFIVFGLYITENLLQEIDISGKNYSLRDNISNMAGCKYNKTKISLQHYISDNILFLLGMGLCILFIKKYNDKYIEYIIKYKYISIIGGITFIIFIWSNCNI